MLHLHSDCFLFFASDPSRPTAQYIALGNLESKYCSSPLIDNICIVADSHHGAPAALAAVNHNNLAELAEELGIPAADREVERLVNNPTMVSAVLAQLTAIATEHKFEKWEKLAAIKLYAEPWTPQQGLLTEAMKLKVRSAPHNGERARSIAARGRHSRGSTELILPVLFVSSVSLCACVCSVTRSRSSSKTTSRSSTSKSRKRWKRGCDSSAAREERGVHGPVQIDSGGRQWSETLQSILIQQSLIPATSKQLQSGPQRRQLPPPRSKQFARRRVGLFVCSSLHIKQHL